MYVVEVKKENVFLKFIGTGATCKINKYGTTPYPPPKKKLKVEQLHNQDESKKSALQPSRVN